VDIIGMAGKLQLETTGPQEKYFTINPDYTYFLEKFKKHSNFSRQYVDIDPESEAAFGRKVRFKIPQNEGDLLQTVSLKCKLPQLDQNMVYIESVGHALIEHVDLLMGGKVIERITSDYLQIYSEQFMTQTKQKALEQLVGKYPLRTTFKRVSEVEDNSGIIIHNTLGLDTDEEFLVDIPFYFYNHPELAVPICAMKYQEVEVEFKLRSVEDLVVHITGTRTNLPSVLESLKPKIKEFSLCTEVVFLDSVERIEMQKLSRDYLITQVQQNTFEVGVDTNKGSFKLDFFNPVKELHFVIQRHGSNVNAADTTLQGNFVTPFDYDNTSNVENGKLILYENLDHLTLQFDGEDIITKDTGSVIFLKAIQGAIHHSKTQLIRRFYSYSFALQPEEWYPTGQINFNLIKEPILNLSMTSCPDFARQIRVYATSYNVLRVCGGKSETLFNYKY
jgi:hypothetical protein